MLPTPASQARWRSPGESLALLLNRADPDSNSYCRVLVVIGLDGTRDVRALDRGGNLITVMGTFDGLLTNSQHASDAQTRMTAAKTAFEQTMTVQAQIVENVATDTATLSTLSTRSQSAQGSLQAQQTTNQLLALVAKQQLQLQTMMAAEFRAKTLDRANRVQSQTDAQSATTKFLGSGTAYTP